MGGHLRQAELHVNNEAFGCFSVSLLKTVHLLNSSETLAKSFV